MKGFTEKVKDAGQMVAICPKCGAPVHEIERAWVMGDTPALYFRDLCGNCGWELFRSGDLHKEADAMFGLN